ncbi:MAG TPA: hypothetical protein VIV15_00530, partial [Anaerolineales bacterium]
RMPVYLLLAAICTVVTAEAASRADEGKVDAIETSYSVPDYNPVNKGTVIAHRRCPRCWLGSALTTGITISFRPC